MATTLAHTWYMTVRHVRGLMRQPWFVAITLVQPVIWLLLYGALFKGVAEIPGFGADSYIEFLTPGIVVMSALFTAGWSGMSMIEDLDRGIIDRFLVSPARRGPIIAGRLALIVVVVAIQATIIVGLGVAAGARFEGGIGGLAVLVAASALLGWGIGSLSNGLALVVRQEQALIGAVQFVILPLLFLSSALIGTDLAPGWIERFASFNPANWAVEAGRRALDAAPDWGFVLARTGALLAFAVVCVSLATRAFRAYQRSV